METRSIAVSLVIRLDDVTTGLPAWPADNTLRVRSGDGFHKPVPKHDGHFVFTGSRPNELHVSSERYEGFTLPVDITGAGLIRVALVPKTLPGGRVFEAELGPGHSAFIGFWGRRGGYALMSAIKTGDCELTLHKEDYAELCGLRHVLMAPDELEACVEILSSSRNGRYHLTEPSPLSFPPRSRLLPLMRIVGGRERIMRIPIPQDAIKIYWLQDSALTQKEL